MLFTRAFSFNVFIKSTIMYPLTCSNHTQTCQSYLYHISKSPQIEQVASLYSVNTSHIKPITRDFKRDYLISVPCACKDVNGTPTYLYDTSYKVESGDTFSSVTSKFYSGQALKLEGEETQFAEGDTVSIHLVCGCLELEAKSQKVVTYTVQDGDTLSDIAVLLSTTLSEIESLNGRLTQDPNFIDVGWVLFVPVEKIETKAPKQKGKSKRHVGTTIIVILSAATLFSIVAVITSLCRRKRAPQNNEEDPKVISKSPSAKKISLQSHLHNQSIEDFEAEKPSIFSLEEIDEATNNFEESRQIGKGGYGSVYFGILGEKEVAIKKMKSSKSKEFFAELKVLGRIHHINVVELLGYASGDNHLYLVYDYVKNGSLSDHLHDPLLKGHQPLSWTARVHIAVDAARGIEYIHDHTKERYVHRDIKTSNILLDQGHRAKVADFGLAKLVARTNEEDVVATRLVGTPGYLPPECVRELQMTTKSDVYAFGVVLGELITGQRAIFRNNREPNKMKSLVSVIYGMFQDEDLYGALEANIDENLKGRYPMEEVHKMVEAANWCVNADAINRPEMREIVAILTQILTSSIEWEASLGGFSPVFSGLLVGR